MILPKASIEFKYIHEQPSSKSISHRSSPPLANEPIGFLRNKAAAEAIFLFPLDPRVALEILVQFLNLYM